MFRKVTNSINMSSGEVIGVRFAAADVGGVSKKNGWGLFGDREGLAGGEAGEGGADGREGEEVVGVSGCEVVARLYGFFNEAATLFAASYCVFVV